MLPFPPRSRRRHPRLRRSYPGADPRSRPLPPATHQTDVLAVPLQDLYTTRSLFLSSLSSSVPGYCRVAFSNFPYAPTNLRFYEGEAEMGEEKETERARDGEEVGWGMP